MKKTPIEGIFFDLKFDWKVHISKGKAQYIIRPKILEEFKVSKDVDLK